MKAKPTLYLIDGSSQLYRAYHAIRGLTGPDGRSTNAVYGFVTMLRKLINDHHPAHIAAAFDVAGPTFRSELSADYKANRRPMPDDLAEQIPWIHRACEALGVPVLTHDRYEADDVIGTLAERAREGGYDVVIVTGDKDFFQLVRDGIKVFNPRDDGTWYETATVREKFGVDPNQVVDVLALMGDSIDNVKGVPGIGEKGARELISTYGSLDALLDRAPQLSQRKYREALVSHREDAVRSRDLVRIDTRVPVGIDLESLTYSGASRRRCFEIFAALGFRSLLMEYAPTAESVDKDYALVRTPQEINALVAELEQAGRLAFRVLTDGEGAMTADIVGFAFASSAGRARYVPVGHQALDQAEQLPAELALAALKPIFENQAIRKVGHDLKSDAVVLARRGITLRGIAVDTMIASYLLDATRSSYPLEDLSLEQLSYKGLTEEAVCGRGAKSIGFKRVPANDLLTYAGERADLSWQLAEKVEPQLAAEGLDDLFHLVEMPLVDVLTDMELTGVRIDAPVLAAQSQHIQRELETLSADIFHQAGTTFNIGSPKQLSEVLFEKLKLPALKRTGKTRAASTAVEVLEELALVHELPRKILEWRALYKLKSTYIDALPELVHPQTGRVHTRFNQAVAATGRLSSSEPNLQNIPIRTDLGREIRRAFTADPGHVLISADYSQIELRVLAHLANDKALKEAFALGKDIHDQTAAKVFGSTSGLSKHELRRRAKIVNYALLYGKTAYTLAKDIGVTPQAAQEFIDAYFTGFPRVRAFIDRLLAESRASGIVKTLFGRRRAVPELNSRNGQIRAAAERITVNMPIQGTAADIMKKAMIDVHRDLRDRTAPARLILQVHDELLLEVPRERADEVAVLVRERMGHAVSLAVPLTVDVGIGENWKEAKN